MKRKSISSYFLSITGVMAIAFTLTSCRKFIDIPPPTGSIVTSQIFADSANATAALNGIYVNMMGNGSTLNFANGGVTIYGGLSADELDNATNVTLYKEFFRNTITITNGNNTNLWTNAYAYIYQTNACIEGVAASTTLSTTVKRRITGEAKFFRALLHFNLVNLYGPVPLTLTTDYRINATMARSPVKDVYTQILADLDDARQLLENDLGPISKTRVNRFSVSALLARVNLYQQQWAAAEAAADKVINANYKLEPVLNNVFLTGNQEQILQMTPVATGYETAIGQLIIPSSATAVPQIIVTPTLLNAFEPTDQRKVQWLKSVTIGTTTYTYPFKYKLGRDLNTAPKEAFSALRLAEQYLIRSEARVQQNNIPGAQSDLNVIRKRAGLDNTTASTQADLLEAIQRERRAELCFEEGHRWFDLKRTRQVDAVLQVNKTGWKSTAALFPIPYTQTQLNPFLEPNPGY